MRDGKVYSVLNGLWMIVVIASLLLVLFGIVSNALSYGLVLLSPEDAKVSVEVVSEKSEFKSAVNFVLAGAVVVLFLVMVVLLVYLMVKRKEKKREVPKFDVFGMQSGLKMN